MRRQSSSLALEEEVALPKLSGSSTHTLREGLMLECASTFKCVCDLRAIGKIHSSVTLLASSLYCIFGKTNKNLVLLPSGLMFESHRS